ncbi:MAG: GGDEF domain-containing protein [Blautia sp.]|nr:GGDEF domain-containing protein [Blautia sp.]
MKYNLRGRIRAWLYPEMTDLEMHEIDQANLWKISNASIVICAVEGILLILSIFVNIHSHGAHLTSLFSVMFCLLICIGVTVSSRNPDRHSDISAHKARIMTSVIYWVMTIWAAIGSFRYYTAGRQMLIFDTVQICFVLFVAFQPLLGIFQTILSYLIFYLVLYHYDQAVQIQLINYVVLILILSTGYVIRYQQELDFIRMNHNLAEKMKALEFTSLHDGLTGLKNRHALREDFPGYYGKTAWIIMTDIDGFKHYNDTYGHDVGDYVLQQIGAMIHNHFGKESSYRYGGDEFLIISALEKKDDLIVLLDNCNHWLSMQRFQKEGHILTLSFSYGIAGGWVENSQDMRNYLKQADMALYEAKKKKKSGDL